MRTSPLHPRQLCLQAAARTLPYDRVGQRDAERCLGNYNRKSEENVEIILKHKISSKF
jgi:hypothetical protein